MQFKRDNDSQTFNHGMVWVFIIALLFGFRISNCGDLDQAGLEARVRHLEERECQNVPDARVP